MNLEMQDFSRATSILELASDEVWPQLRQVSNVKVWTNKEDEYHRDDGPAVEWVDGSNFWYKDGKFHRLDGPACTWVCQWSNDRLEWHIEGKQLTEEEFYAHPECTIKQDNS